MFQGIQSNRILLEKLKHKNNNNNIKDNVFIDEMNYIYSDWNNILKFSEKQVEYINERDISYDERDREQLIQAIEIDVMIESYFVEQINLLCLYVETNEIIR